MWNNKQEGQLWSYPYQCTSYAMLSLTYPILACLREFAEKRVWPIKLYVVFRHNKKYGLSRGDDMCVTNGDATVRSLDNRGYAMLFYGLNSVIFEILR